MLTVKKYNWILFFLIVQESKLDLEKFQIYNYYMGPCLFQEWTDSTFTKCILLKLLMKYSLTIYLYLFQGSTSVDYRARGGLYLLSYMVPC